jgi:hypothetical protein
MGTEVGCMRWSGRCASSGEHGIGPVPHTPQTPGNPRDQESLELDVGKADVTRTQARLSPKWPNWQNHRELPKS